MRIIPPLRTLLFALVVLAMSSASFAQIRISVGFGPPALPVYDQPLCPGDGYLWAPGYWAWDDDDGDFTGCRARGCWLPKSVSCGLRPIGPGAMALLFSMRATGARMWVSTEESFTASAILVLALSADVGTAIDSSTTAPS